MSKLKMIDPELKGWDKDQRLDYIFKDIEFEGRTRVDWINNCLLGDIRTYLEGIKKFVIESSDEIFGGGNLSVPILVSSALEFLAALYAGKTKYIGPYNATNNVKNFIEDFFEGDYKKVPLLLQDGMRNGLVHTFYPKTFTHSASSQNSIEYIEFEFAVQTHRETLWYQKDGNRIVLCINIFDLFEAFENAVDAYIEKLRTDKYLQNKFIKAWSSIEQYEEVVDQNQEHEVSEIINNLSRTGG